MKPDEISSTAQELLDAYWSADPYRSSHNILGIAEVCRVLADKVTPHEGVNYLRLNKPTSDITAKQRMLIRTKLLCLAYELRHLAKQLPNHIHTQAK